MRRFENAQVGDLVYCRKNGNGIIASVWKYAKSPYKIRAKFKKYDSESYTLCGFMTVEDAEPMLFYRKGEEKYLTERPEPEIDWENVKQGSMFSAEDCECPNMPERPFHIFDGTIPWFRHSSLKDHLFSWKIIKPVNPLEIPYK